jgi:phosphoribosylformimino-5-aminoimidazole carboxamide ribotide isomerase
MEVIPVLDLKGGQVVHARGGRRDEYRPIQSPLAEGSAPEAVVAGLLSLFPFRNLYIADLDAIEGQGDHGDVVARLARAHPNLDLWVDRGVGALSVAHDWLGRDLGSLVLGSESQSGVETVRALVAHPRVVLSLDFRDSTFLGPMALLANAALWPARVVVMTLARVGAGSGPDFAGVVQAVERAGGRAVYAAGGVRDLKDLSRLAAIGAAGALVATALHNGALGAPELNEIARPQGPGEAACD